MSETPAYNPESIEQQESASEQIEAVYGNIDGFEDYQAALETVSPELQARMEELFLVNKDDFDFVDALNWEMGGQFPLNDMEMRTLIEQYGGEDVYIEASLIEKREDIAEEDAIQAEEDAIQAEEDAIQAENREKEDEVREEEDYEEVREQRLIGNFQELLTNLRRRNIPGITIPDINFADIDQVEIFVQENLRGYLETAKNHSDGAFRAVYSDFQGFAESSSEDFPDLSNAIRQQLESFETDFLVPPPDTEEVQAALGDSRITDIDGDIIRGENGEVIDLSGTGVELSLAGEDGLLLEVGQVERIDQRADKLEISQLEHEKQANLAEIVRNTEKIQSLEGVIANYEARSDEFFDSEENQDIIARDLAGLQPRTGIVEQIERGISGSILKSLVIDFFSDKVDGFRQRNVDLEDRNDDIEMRVGVLAARMETQRRMLELRMQMQKERVRNTQRLLESMGVSRVVAEMMEIFPRISASAPVHLPDGNIISSLNIATLEMEGSFEPALGEGGAEDFPTQKVVAELMNMALSDDGNISIDFSSTGTPIFIMNGDQVDKMDFDNRVGTLVGDIGFRSRMLARLGLSS